MILRERESLDHELVDYELIDHRLDHELVILGVLDALGAFGAFGALGVGALPFFFLVMALY